MDFQNGYHVVQVPCPIKSRIIFKIPYFWLKYTYTWHEIVNVIVVSVSSVLLNEFENILEIVYIMLDVGIFKSFRTI